MADTERLINKAQGDSIISAIHGITARLQEMYTVDDAMSSSSENPVQNKVVKAALDDKVDVVSGKGLSTKDYTNEDKESVANSAEQLESTQTVSGNPLTLTDCAPINAESLVVELEPKQDLHGYDYPWVGGAGKNKCPMDLQNGKTGTGRAWTIKTDADGNKIGIVLNGTHVDSSRYFATIASIYLESGNYYLSGAYNDNAALELIGDGVDIYNNNAENPTAFTISTSGTYTLYMAINTNVALSNAELKPMIRLSTETDPTFAPYSNICPITGYDECEVDDVGKNKCNESLFNSEVSSAQYCKFTNGKIQFKNTAGTSYYPTVVIDGDKLEAGTYTLSTSNVEGSDSSDVLITAYTVSEISYSYLGEDYTFTINDGDNIYVRITTNNTTASGDCSFNVQIESGSTSTTYEPYQSSNATIQFGQTVMGGKVNVTDGGTDDEYEYADDLDTWSWTAEGEGYFFAIVSDAKLNGKITCSMYKGVQKLLPDNALTISLPTALKSTLGISRIM